jgi:hypothetical protein
VARDGTELGNLDAPRVGSDKRGKLQTSRYSASFPSALQSFPPNFLEHFLPQLFIRRFFNAPKDFTLLMMENESLHLFSIINYSLLIANTRDSSELRASENKHGDFHLR